MEEDLADLGTITVNGRHHDVGGTVMSELHDELGQVSFPGRNALLLEVLVEVGLLGGDRLDLDDLVDPLVLGDLGDDAVGLLAVTGPVDVDAVGGEVLLSLDQVVIQVTADAVLDGLGGVAQILPVRGLGDAQGALVANRRGGIAHVLALHRQIQLILGGLRELRHTHVRTGLVGGRGQPGDTVIPVGDAT